MSETFSIVTKTYNDEDDLPDLLSSLKNSGQYVEEVIVVDAGSSDDTIAIAKDFQAKVVRIPHKDFNAPYALNVGIEQAQGDYIGLLSPGAVPVYEGFIKQSLPYLKHDKVAGVYSFSVPNKSASYLERLIFFVNNFKIYQKPKVVDSPKLSIMSPRNAFFPRKLWEERRFDLEMNEGGESLDWALHWLDQGYKFIWHPKLAVYYGKGHGLIESINRYQARRKRFKEVVGKHLSSD